MKEGRRGRYTKGARRVRWGTAVVAASRCAVAVREIYGRGYST